MNVGAVASIALGVVFLVAGGSKLAAGPTWHVQARELGAPALVTPVIPWLELVIGATLVVQFAQPIPAVVSILLLLGFTAAIALRLAEGERPACACFGAWSAKPIGAGHLARNGVLLGLALVAALA
ncbi:MAG: hypothetical protein HKN41_12490 [Ilumatobacter sp.]|nr:hypothetical protein [Ilumatobacter sp.]